MKTRLLQFSKILKACSLGMLIWISMINISVASHMGGGEITYEWVSGNTYTVRFSHYSDCAGLVPAPSFSMGYSSSCFPGGAMMLYLVGSSQQISPICAASLPNSSCNGGTLFALWRSNYEGTVTLPGPCANWTFEFSACCRNGNITNVINPDFYNFYVSTTLNNLDVPFNNSVVFGGNPIHIIYNNSTTNINWNAYDPDGDSLVFELTNAEDAYGVSLPYAAGFTPTQPFLSSLPTAIDATTGIITASPNALQSAVVAVRVREFRNGIPVSITRRDFTITTVNSTNSLPALTGMNGTGQFVTNGCPGDTITFDVLSSDPDPLQNLGVTMDPNSTNAVLNATAGQYPVGTFSWSPVAGDVSSQPYIFMINVNDDHCDYYGTQSYAYHVYVNGCNTNDVWPGDANSDGNANLYDLLAVGLAFGDNGPVRPSANLNWIAQPCPGWTNTFISGINHKHADTDGDGTVNIADTTAIFQNYGLNHPLRTGNPGIATVADLLVTASDDTVGLSATVHFDIAIATPVDSIYGLAFRLYFDPAMIDLNSISATYAGSVFGTNGADMIKIDRSQGMNGFVDIALSRINQLNITGTGDVVRVTIVTTDNVSGKVMLNVSPFDITGVTLNESIVPLNGIGDVVVIDPNFVGINEVHPGQLVQVFPSPASDYINFTYSGSQQVDNITLYDVAGKEVLHLLNPDSVTTINIKGISKGTYLLKAGIGENNVYKKIMVN